MYYSISQLYVLDVFDSCQAESVTMHLSLSRSLALSLSVCVSTRSLLSLFSWLAALIIADKFTISCHGHTPC